MPITEQFNLSSCQQFTPKYVKSIYLHSCFHVAGAQVIHLIKCHLNIYQAMGKFSRRQTGDIFLTFPRTQDLTLHENYSERDNLHEVSDPIFLEK